MFSVVYCSYLQREDSAAPVAKVLLQLSTVYPSRVQLSSLVSGALLVCLGLCSPFPSYILVLGFLFFR